MNLLKRFHDDYMYFRNKPYHRILCLLLSFFFKTHKALDYDFAGTENPWARSGCLLIPETSKGEEKCVILMKYDNSELTTSKNEL